MGNIEIIMKYPLDQVVRHILEEMKPHEIASIRSKLKPHWTDGKYDKWSHNDPLFKICFKDLGLKTISYKDGYTGDMETDTVKHIQCKFCNEELVQDKDYHDNRYSHLFAFCPVLAKLRWEANSEEEFRNMVKEKL